MTISTSAPHAVADAIRFTSSPGENTWEGLYGQDWDDHASANEDLIRRHDDLALLRLDINSTPYLAARADGDWVVIPVHDEELQQNRGFLTVPYGFAGGDISSGGEARTSEGYGQASTPAARRSRRPPASNQTRRGAEAGVHR